MGLSFQIRAIRANKILPRATTGLQKCGPGWVGPLKNSGPRAKFRIRLWHDPALSGPKIDINDF